MYKYFLIAIFVFAVVLVVCLIIKKSKRKKEVTNKLTKLCSENGYSLKREKEEYIIEGNEKRLLFVVSDIPSNSSVTVNSRTTWCLRWGGKRYGRGYPNQRYLNELNDFLKLKTDDTKVIILYKTTEKILMYLNESEIDEVKEGKTIYDYKIVTFNNLEKVFSKLFE